jgi:hypothetical protein
MERISDIFNIRYGNQFDFSKMEVSKNESDINFISRGSRNNGFVAKVKPYMDIEPFSAGAITVTMGGSYLLASFVQPYPFYTAQNIKVLTPKFEMSLAQKLYYCAIIQHNRFRYHSHSREANSTFDDIIVPSIDELPKLDSLDIKYANKRPLVGKEFILDTAKWKWFSIKKLFPILEKCKCTNATALLTIGDEIAYVGAKKSFNGVMAYVKQEDKLVTRGNCIMFIGDGQGSIGYSLYQPYDFIGSSTLVVGYNEHLNKYNALFLVTILDLERYRYSFGRKYNKSAIAMTKVKLPQKSDGTPDWDYMESYIKSRPYSTII